MEPAKPPKSRNPAPWERSEFGRRVVAAAHLRKMSLADLKKAFDEEAKRLQQRNVAEYRIARWIGRASEDPRLEPQQLEALKRVLGVDDAWLYHKSVDEILGASAAHVPLGDDDRGHSSGRKANAGTREAKRNRRASEGGRG